MTTVSAGPAPQSALSRISQMAASAVGAKKKGEDKKDDDKAEDKKDDDKAEDKKDDDKADKDKETDDDEPVEKKGKKKGEDGGDDDEAKSAKDGDDDSDEDDKSNKDAKAARRRERGRIAAIVTSKSATHSMSNLSYAVHLACNTSMPRSEAIGLLNHVSRDDPAPAAEKKDVLRERMQDAPKPDIGADAGGGKGPNLAAQIILAGKKRRGEKVD